MSLILLISNSAIKRCNTVTIRRAAINGLSALQGMPRNRERDLLADIEDEDEDEQGSRESESESSNPVATDEDVGDGASSSCTDSTRRRVRKEWTLLNLFDRGMLEEEEIANEVLKIANKKMSDAGCLPPDNYRERPNQLGLWKLNSVHMADGGVSEVQLWACHFRYRCKCPAMLKVVHSPGNVTVYESQMHDLSSHVVDRSKHLTLQQKAAVEAAVRMHPLAQPKSVRRNLCHLNQPGLDIRPEQERNMRYLMKKVRTKITSESLGVEVDGTYGSLVDFASKIFIGDLLKKHNDRADEYHLTMFDTMCLGYQVDSSSNIVYLVLSNTWMMFNIVRALISGWPMELQGDGSPKVSDLCHISCILR